MMRSFDDEEWEMFEQNDLREGTFPEGSVWRPVGKVVMAMPIRLLMLMQTTLMMTLTTLILTLTTLIPMVITSLMVKIVAGDGALRKDVVLVPSSLPPSEQHHRDHYQSS